MGPLVCSIRVNTISELLELSVHKTNKGSRAGGPGESKEDVKWLDSHLKALLEDEKWQLDASQLE